MHLVLLWTSFGRLLVVPVPLVVVDEVNLVAVLKAHPERRLAVLVVTKFTTVAWYGTLAVRSSPLSS